MPSIFGLYKRYREHIKDFCLVRLHGPDRKGIEKKTSKNWNQIVEPKEKELNDLTHMVNDLQTRGVQVTVNGNNHYEGSAPQTINRFVDMLTRTSIR